MRPLSLPLPLRDTTAWGGYREAVPIPHRYGATAGALLQYNASRTEFAWAGHAVEAIDEVLVDGLPVGDWDWRNAVDAQGLPVALVRFGQPQNEGAALLARGRGKLDARRGGVMTNPADVVADVLALAGRDVPASALADFRRACSAAGLEVGGSIETAETAQTVLRGICESIGAIVCADMPGWCRLWPGSAPAAPRATVRDGDLSASVSSDGLVNDLTIAYAHEDGQPRASLRLEAPDSIAAYGRRPATLEARWVTSARVAAAVGTRLLQQSARPVWAVSVAASRALQVGDALALAHPASPVGGVHPITARELDLDAGGARLSINAPVGDVPAVRLIAQSSAFEPARYAGLSVETAGGERILTLREETGAPIVGAAVTLDDALTRYTDGAGRVAFPVATMPPGEHMLAIKTADGRTLTTTVLIA
jgi:hypothetical protein